MKPPPRTEPYYSSKTVVRKNQFPSPKITHGTKAHANPYARSVDYKS